MLNITNGNKHLNSHWMSKIYQRLCEQISSFNGDINMATLLKGPISSLLHSPTCISIMTTISSSVLFPSLLYRPPKRVNSLSDQWQPAQACSYWMFGRGFRISFPVCEETQIKQVLTLSHKYKLSDYKSLCYSRRHRTCCILLKLSDSGQRYWGKTSKMSTSKPNMWTKRIFNKTCYFILAAIDKGYIDGATTRLCIPAKKRAIRVMQLMVKKGWFHSDEKKETCIRRR